MTRRRLDIVILGLSITSSWGNGHATTYRGLVRELTARGHHVLFLERDMVWYAHNRDLPQPGHGRTVIYRSVAELKRRFAHAIRDADLVMVGSYVPEGASVGEWVIRTTRGISAFYDIDTPVTLARLARGELEYLNRWLIPRYDLYFSFTGGPTLERLEQEYGARSALALYCSVDPAIYFPEPVPSRYDLGYMGTYSPDRQRQLTHLMLLPARSWWSGRFVVVGPQYPAAFRWPANVRRIEHLPPANHRAFYNSQRFTLNLTRADMRQAGFSPSVRLFEAAACGTPIISDTWDGLADLLCPGQEVLLAESETDILAYVRDLPEERRLELGARARARILAEHTAAHRAAELEGHVFAALSGQPAS
ncbi:MAG TPA: glycosyltransferase [Gemmatimonadales bacterium]|nr:glycosyltransferase [Gemmatimonadales bacterium]